MNICEHLSLTARLFPNREAIVFSDQRISYAQLDQRSIAAAEQLQREGVQRGDRVALVLPNVPAFAVWYYGALRLGAIVVSVNARSAAAEIEFILNDCGAKVFVTDQTGATRWLDELGDSSAKPVVTSTLGDTCGDVRLQPPTESISQWQDLDPNEPALILYTSGTTGFPKGATLSHQNVRSNVNAFNHLCGTRPGDRVLLTVPLSHCFGQNALLNSVLNVGGALIMQQNFDVNESKQLIRDERVNQLYCVPMMFQLFLECCEPSDLESVEYCFSAAAILPVQVGSRWMERFGLAIHEGYGLTETSPFASYNHHLDFVPGSIGTPIDCVEMKVVDTESGETCPVGALGEIAIRGPNVMLGYWNRPEETKAAIRAGWFYSGDIGKMDQRGFFYIVDRVKDMIAVAGLKVYPAEVERVLMDHPAVADAAVIGAPDEVFGEQVVAYVVLNEHAKNSGRDDIETYATGKLARFKTPRRVLELDALPRNPSGKVLKKELRKQVENEDGQLPVSEGSQPDPLELNADSSEPKEAPTLSEQLLLAYPADRQRIGERFVLEAVKLVMDTEEPLDLDARFLDLGMDSLMVVELSKKVQLEVGQEQTIPATLVFDYPTLRSLSGFLVDSLNSDPSAKRPQVDSAKTPSQSVTRQDTLRDEVVSLSDDEALAALLKEISE